MVENVVWSACLELKASSCEDADIAGAGASVRDELAAIAAAAADADEDDTGGGSADALREAPLAIDSRLGDVVRLPACIAGGD